MSKRKILCRADGNSSIGLGHMYRMLAIAEFFKNEYDIIFVTKKDSSTSIIPKAYKISYIPEDVSTQDEPRWLSNNFTILENIIIADGYQFVSSYQRGIKREGFKLIYIDDLVKEHMYADVVINHSPKISVSDYQSEKYTKFALGLDYALLRPVFLAQTKLKREIKNIDSVFLCFGGADKDNFTLKMYNLLRKMNFIKEIHIIIGAAYKHSIKDFKDDRAILYNNLNENDLIEVMYKCNLAIAPTSTILLELCCINIPIISGYLEENQKKAYKALYELGAISGIGDFKKVKLTKTNLKNKINLLEIETLLKTQSQLFNKNQIENFKQLIYSL
ncbi:UDP-2,4-diacetamido-2,4,6-trideoxy-beta-L-altropyranose hydrolase [Bizionia sp.]|uniref:UDP-2,4-diacetamido-2,4, 6-trideoxy-beta-L-altropyranose hydrolase n=1 Tax=Bizionia sp. TaxID=1954480 RepID=UPI003A8EB908